MPTVRGRRGAGNRAGDRHRPLFAHAPRRCRCANGYACRPRFRGAARGSRRSGARHRPDDRGCADRADQPDPARDLSRQGQGRGDHRSDHRARHRTGGDGLRAVADPAAQSREGLEHQGARPHRADPRNLRPPRQDQGRRAAGRTRASELSAQPPGAVMDPSRAPARRLRLHGRSRRNPDRGRPPPDRRPHHRGSRTKSRRCRRRGGCIAPAGSGCRIAWWRWSATPMPESRRCSTA